MLTPLPRGLPAGRYIFLTLFLAVTLEAFEAKYDPNAVRLGAKGGGMTGMTSILSSLRSGLSSLRSGLSRCDMYKCIAAPISHAVALDAVSIVRAVVTAVWAEQPGRQVRPGVLCILQVLLHAASFVKQKAGREALV